MSTLKELRKEASELGIKRYSRMTKSQLEAEIAKITDNSQHEKPQTCSIPDTTNITPADDTQEDTQNAQPENVKFVVGKTYLCGHSVWGLDWDGYKATHHSYKITITGRKGNYLTIHDELYGETAKRKLFANEKGVEYIRPKGSYGAYRKLVLFADYPTVEPEIPTTLPPDVANNESDNTAQPAEAANTESELGKWLALQDHWKKLAWLANGGLGTLSYLNATPETVAESIAKGISAQEYEITKQFCNCEYSPSKFRAMLNCFTMSGINKYLDMLIHFHRPQNFSKNQAIEFLVTTYIPLWEKEQAKRKAFTAHLANTQSETTAQPEALYDDDSYSDFSGDNSSTDMDIPEEHEPDIIPETHDNPGFTVIPHDRMHIERPEYTVYPDTITDECPYTVIPACDIPAHNPAAAVVPYADARNIRNFFHILAIYIRMWLAINIHKLNIAIPMPGVFPPDYVIAKSTTAKKRPALIPQKQERKEAWQSHSCQYCENDPRPEWTHKQFALGIILSTEYSNYKTKTRYCTKSMSEWLRDKYTLVQLYKINKALGYQLLLSYNPSTKKAAFALSSAIADTVLDMEHYYVCTYEVLNPPALPVELQKYFTSRADCLSPIIIPAAVKDITPQHEKKEHAPASAQELDGKLIDTANLHGNDWRNAHRHNISVITSCMFHEAVTALLQKVSVSTIREIGGQLGTLNRHVKGNKSQLIARVVDRLFEIRSIRNKKTVTTTL